MTRSNDELRQRLIEYLLGCAEDEAAIERLLAEDATAQAELEAAKREVSWLESAARAPEFQFEPEPVVTLKPARSPGWRAVRWAAALLLLLPALTKAAGWFGARQAMLAIEQETLALNVTAPKVVTPGAPVAIQVEALNLHEQRVTAEVTWRALDAEGASLDTGSQPIEGEGVVEIPGTFELASVELEITRGEVSEKHRVDLSRELLRPLVHVAQDKPVYRPEETASFRVVTLDRLTNEPFNGRVALQVRGPDDALLFQTDQALRHGVAYLDWRVPPDASGGNYSLHVTNTELGIVEESHSFLVRRFRTPRLATTIDLDRRSYAPGGRLVAELRSERVEGRLAAGAQVTATCVVDGEEIAVERLTLDETGSELVAFELPASVEHGEGRLFCRVEHEGVVETKTEVFAIPTGKLTSRFLPEGGELVRGVENRVYCEFTDSLGRPADVRGRIVDQGGNTVAFVRTEHLGWARFELTPQEGERYTFESDEGDTRAELPASVAGVAHLRALDESTRAGRSVRFACDLPDDRTYRLALFCRGVLVATERLEGRGRQECELDPSESIAGVLRATLFGPDLEPIAERLVHRESARSLDVAIELKHDELHPGDRQQLAVLTTDETGKAVDTYLGLSVSDHAVWSLLDDVRVGLADRAWLLSDVASLEEHAGFSVDEPERARHIDLLLGTRGWRRFGWRPEAASELTEEVRGRQFLAREGLSARHQVASASKAFKPEQRAWSERRRAMNRARGDGIGFAIIGGWLVLSLFTAVWLFRRGKSRVNSAAWGLGMAMILPTAGLVPYLLGGGSDSAPGAILTAAVEDSAVAVTEELNESGSGSAVVITEGQLVDLIGLGYLNDLGYIGSDDRTLQLEALGYSSAVVADPALPRDTSSSRPAAEEPVEADEEFSDFEVPGRRAERRGRSGVFAYVHRLRALRDDFTETILWHPLARTGNGHFSIEFDTSDRITTWQVFVDAHGAGRVGQGSATFTATKPFYLDVNLPVEVSAGDRVELPVGLAGSGMGTGLRQLVAKTNGPALLDGTNRNSWRVETTEDRAFVALEIGDGVEPVELWLGGRAGDWNDAVGHRMRVVPRGFPIDTSEAGVLEGEHTLEVALPEAFDPYSLEVDLSLFPSMFADFLEGIASLLRDPHGCFEQTSSAHYPNILAVRFLDASGTDRPAMRSDALAKIERGYARLRGFECSNGGFELYGRDPGSLFHTAYGLFEFTDQNAVLSVDDELLKRTWAWLDERRDGSGGFRPLRDSRFGPSAAILDTYVLSALLESGAEVEEYSVEIAALERRVADSQDPYVLALGGRALSLAGLERDAREAATRLVQFQQVSGLVEGAESSVTRSGGRGLDVETTALAVLAWLEVGGFERELFQATNGLLACRSNGSFGSTQATVQALRALGAFASRTQSGTPTGDVIVSKGGAEVARVAVAPDALTAVRIDLAPYVDPGTTELSLRFTGEGTLPFEAATRYFAESPATVVDAPVTIATRLASSTVDEGAPVTLFVELENRGDSDVATPLAIVGLPAGLTAPTELLDALVDAKKCAHWQTRGRELVFYLDGLEAGETREFTLELIAALPGVTTGAASRAYPYYEPEAKAWAAPLKVTVER